jgi:beta-glucosidase
VLFHEETARGLAVKEATSFSIPPALGSTWDPALVERSTSTIRVVLPPRRCVT